MGCLDIDVRRSRAQNVTRALRQRRAENVEAERLSEENDSGSDSDSDSGSEAVLKAVEPLALEGGVAVVTCEVEVIGAAEGPSEAAGGGGLTSATVGHQEWEAPWVRAYNEVLGGELQSEVRLLQGAEAEWAEELGGEEEEPVEGDGQDTHQPGGRASAVTRKRVEREEQSGGVKRRGHPNGAGRAGVKKRRQNRGKSAQGRAAEK